MTTEKKTNYYSIFAYPDYNTEVYISLLPNDSLLNASSGANRGCYKSRETNAMHESGDGSALIVHQEGEGSDGED